MAVPSCYAYPSPDFQRAMRLVSGITNASNGVVTTTFAHNYLTGDIVRMMVPVQYGMFELNKQIAQITVIDETSFYLNIDTLLYSAYVTPVSNTDLIRACPHVVPVGEINSSLLSATQNVL